MRTKSFAELTKSFAKNRQHILQQTEKIASIIAEKKKEVELLEKAQRELSDTLPVWTEALLKPIVQKLKKEFRGWQIDSEDLRPIGRTERVTVFFNRISKGKNSGDIDNDYIYITFSPGDLNSGQLFYDTGEKIDNDLPDNAATIKSGMNNVHKELESIEEAVRHLQNQINKLPSTRRIK